MRRIAHFSAPWLAAGCLLAALGVATVEAQVRPSRSGELDDEAVEVAKRYLKRNPERARGLVPLSLDDRQLARPAAFVDERSGVDTLYNPFDAVLEDIGRTLLAARDLDNLQELYGLLYKTLPKELTGDLMRPARFNTLRLRKAQAQIKQIFAVAVLRSEEISQLQPPFAFLPLAEANPIGDCLAEVGYEVAGPDSETSARCDVGDYAPDGLFANFDFPLKDKLTCIRNQGKRGTCVAHAIVAAVESETLVDGGPAENLSEQDLYWEGEAEATSDITQKQTYGLSTTGVLQHMDASDYQIQFEREWNYNRSPNMKGRSPNPGTNTFDYPASCGDYSGESCSDYAFQSTAVLPMPGVLVPVRPSVPATGARELTDVTVLVMEPVVTADITLANAILLLGAGVPLVVTTTTTDSFGRGKYIVYTANDPLKGGHAMELVGYVEAADAVAIGAPQPVGDGYFIVKNSWGRGAGDCGFQYIDHEYLRIHGISISSIVAR